MRHVEGHVALGRRLTERLEGAPEKTRRHQLIMMLDEFPAPVRLDFFEGF